MEFDLVMLQQHIISVIIFGDPNHQPWALTFVHSPCGWWEKEIFWENVSSIDSNFAGPWLVLGDFNAVSRQREKWGG